MANERGFSLVELMIVVALMGFLALAGYSLVATTMGAAGDRDAIMNARHASFSTIERVRKAFNALGGGFNQREIRPLGMTMTERRALGAGRFQIRQQMGFATRCQNESDPKFPRSLLHTELPPIPSTVCAGFVCGKGARPVVDETRTINGKSQRKIHPNRFNPIEEPVATAMCFQQLVGYVQVEQWSARRIRTDSGNRYVWDRQAALIPLTPSLTGNVSYLPARD